LNFRSTRVAGEEGETEVKSLKKGVKVVKKRLLKGSLRTGGKVKKKAIIVNPHTEIIIGKRAEGGDKSTGKIA